LLFEIEELEVEVDIFRNELLFLNHQQFLVIFLDEIDGIQEPKYLLPLILKGLLEFVEKLFDLIPLSLWSLLDFDKMINEFRESFGLVKRMILIRDFANGIDLNLVFETSTFSRMRFVNS
jgi:hypothetical protein